MAEDQKKNMQDEVAHYREIGFMCGLEVHQRLATSRKLFCSCKTEQAGGGDSIIGTVQRYQRAVAGELGDIDKSAEFEGKKQRKFTYQVHENETCLVEIDEEPPHEIDQDALMVSLAVAKALGMKSIDEMQPMRKEVVDGSDPSAFQRTMLVAVDGAADVEGHKIIIPSMFLEEESCGIVSGKDDAITYDTERLGIPLVEIDTDPYIPTPGLAKAAARHIGTVLRVSGRVQRGIGSIRQDVNVSIRGGVRVEIKGLQEVDKIDRFIENEVIRQQKLLEIRGILTKAGAKTGEAIDVSEALKGSKVRIVTGHLEKNGKAYAFGLSGFSGILGTEVSPQRRLGTEISDYAKMAGVNGIIHSDEDLAGYGFSEEELNMIRKAVGSEYDSFVLVAGRTQDAERAASLAQGRANAALVGVPLETRGVASTELCTTRFLRPLPGGSRMYPETDAKPVSPSIEMLELAHSNAPDAAAERDALQKALNNKALVEQLVLSPKLQLYKTIIAATKADKVFVANTLMQKFTELRRNGFEVDALDEHRLVDLFAAYARNEITKQAVDELLKEASKNNKSIAEIIKEKKLERVSGKKLDELIAEMQRNPDLQAGKDAIRNGIMSKYRLTVDGAELNAALSKYA